MVSNFFLCVNKPPGITSFDVIRKMRKITGIKKIGHCGTLDPFATGLLILSFNKATRFIPFLMNQDKEYIATLILGEKTATGDTEGKLIDTKPVPRLKKEMILQSAEKMKDLKEQIPPLYSAVKVEGKALYRYAGLNETVPEEIIKKKIRKISIHDFSIVDISLPYISYKTKVSKGTYIRSLSESFADILSSIATTHSLKRTASGNLTLSDAVDLDTLSSDNWENYKRSIPDVLSYLDKVYLEDEEIDFFINGRLIPPGNHSLIKSNSCLKKDHTEFLIFRKTNGLFCGLGKFEMNKSIKPVRVVL